MLSMHEETPEEHKKHEKGVKELWEEIQERDIEREAEKTEEE